MITPVRRTTPRKSLETIYDVLPLDIQGKLEAISTLKRNKNFLKLRWPGLYPDKKTYIGHRLHWQCMTDDTDYGFNITTDKINGINPPQFYKINLNSMKTQTLPTESQINIYIQTEA